MADCKQANSFLSCALESNQNGEQALLCLMYCKWIGLLINEHRERNGFSAGGGIIQRFMKLFAWMHSTIFKLQAERSAYVYGHFSFPLIYPV